MIIRISIYHVIDRLGLIKLIRDVERNGLKIAKDKVDKINDDNELILDIDDRYFREFNKTCLFKIMPKMQKNQFEFKPFDKVVVKNHNMWTIDFFVQYNNYDKDYPYCGISASWEQCLPYNEETAHLIGTNKPYKPSEPKIWQIASTGYNDTMTSEELSNFIQGAVINNKDITDFRIRYIGQ